MNALILRLPDLVAVLALSKSTIYSRVKEGLLPPPISLGSTASGWVAVEVEYIINCMLKGCTREQLKYEVEQLVHERSAKNIKIAGVIL